MPMGIEHEGFDVMIEAIESDYHKKKTENCSQAERLFEALDDQRTDIDETTGRNEWVAGVFNLAQTVGDDASLPASVAVYCSEFQKNVCGLLGYPLHVSVFAGVPSDLGGKPTEVLTARLERWTQSHKYYLKDKNIKKVLVLFEDQSDAKASLEAEAACNTLDMFFVSVHAAIDQKELRMVIGHKIKEVLQKLVLEGAKLPKSTLPV